MDESGSSQFSIQGFHTAFGTEWFDLSATKVKEYFYEIATAANSNKTYLPDISFSTVLDMSSLNIDELEDQPVFGSNLYMMLDVTAKENTRLEMLARICGAVFKLPEHGVLHHQVVKLVEADLMAANIKFDPEHSLLSKSLAMATHVARLGITRQARFPRDEFCIHLYKLSTRQVDNIEIVRLYFSYATNFGSFLSALRDETALQRVNGGFTLEDGPWKYKVTANGRIRGPWYDMLCEKSFEDMLHKLKLAEDAAVIIHSVEDSIQRQYQEEEMEESKLRQSAEVILDADGKPFFCSTSYLEYLATQPQ